MATWQADYYLVSSNAEEVSKELRRDYSWWAKEVFPKKAEIEIIKLLAKIKSWHKDLEVFGEDAGTRIDLWKKNDNVESVLVRINLGEINEKFIESLIFICNESKIKLLDENNEVVLAEKYELISSLKKSVAFKFVSDPIEFLNSLSNEKKE